MLSADIKTLIPQDSPLESILKDKPLTPEQEADLRAKWEAATKEDGAKVRMSLLPFLPLEEVAAVLTLGAKKYSAHNWRKGFAYSRLTDAALRHISAFNEGETLDVETNLTHIAHAICELLFLLEQIQLQRGEDDRYLYTDRQIARKDVIRKHLSQVINSK